MIDFQMDKSLIPVDTHVRAICKHAMVKVETFNQRMPDGEVLYGGTSYHYLSKDEMEKLGFVPESGSCYFCS